MTHKKERIQGADHRKSSGCTGLDNPDEPLMCVFSTQSAMKVGTGTTAKKQIMKLLWYVKQEDVDAFGVRKINPQFVPVGEPEIIDQETLLNDYTPEVELHNTQVQPAMKNLNKALAKGDKHRQKGENHSAEMEYTKALDVDETNVRAIFGLGLVYLDREDKEKSQAVFEQLVELDAAFAPQHKHLFNEFGIALRKARQYENAVQYYDRAVEICEPDENLYYNLSRAYYENDELEQCMEFTAKALKLNPGLDAARSMCGVIIKLGNDEKYREKLGKAEVPDSALKRAEFLLGDFVLSTNDMEMMPMNSSEFGGGESG